MIGFTAMRTSMLMHQADQGRRHVTSNRLETTGKRMGWVWFAAFLIIGLIAIVASVKDRQNADAEQSELKADTNRAGLGIPIDKLTQPIGKAVGATTRDPDTIYQNGAAAGHVVGARITLNQSQVYFEQIENAGNLDQSKTFEYRDYVLRLVRADSIYWNAGQPERGCHQCLSACGLRNWRTY